VTRAADSGLQRPDDHIIVLFGATGDLAKRKLIPGLYRLSKAGLMPRNFRIIGTTPPAFAKSHDEFLAFAREAIETFAQVTMTAEEWNDFSRKLSFAPAELGDEDALRAAVDAAKAEIGTGVRLLHHLAVPPQAFGAMVELLDVAGLVNNARVVCEKPFGTDLHSAQELNRQLRSHFHESQIFRIDHFLGKESVDNILALRFANGLFEPMWNRDSVSYVQIDVPEEIDIAGRATFFEETGAFRDMVVTHLFQVLGVVAMEPPVSLEAKPLRDEMVKVFNSMNLLDVSKVVRGQYVGYINEPGVSPYSQAETFVALQCEVDNWRWKGVPFFLRTGKAMAASRQVITVGFREPVMRIFDGDHGVRGRRGNKLVIDFADPGSIDLHFFAKSPGPQMRLGNAQMSFSYEDSFSSSHNLQGYEQLILNAMIGNQALFTRSDGIERLWEISQPLLDSPPPIEIYDQGTWGPDSANELVTPFHWFLPE
jgi:glucose-6-phosphate 1-dehydrogenase